MGAVGCAVAAATVLVAGGLGDAVCIWQQGSEKVSEEWEQNSCGNCVRNGVLVAVCLATVSRVEDQDGGSCKMECTALGSGLGVHVLSCSIHDVGAFPLLWCARLHDFDKP